MRASLSFNLPVSSPAHLVPSRDPLVEVLKSAVVNPRDVVQSPRMVVTPAPEPLKTDVSSTKAAIEVGQTGLTQITYENLSSSGFPVTSVNPLNLHLSRAGKEVAYEWDGDGDAKFELNERLLFYAAPRFSRYASFDVYFVEERDSPGLLMGNRTADPAGFPIGAARVEITAEENRIYTPDCFCAPIPAGRDGDRWVWDRLQIDSHPLESYLLELHGVDPSQPATLNLWLIGYTDVAAVPDHHVKVSLNGTPIGDLEWDGKGSFSASFIILGSLLVNGDNTLTLSLSGAPFVEIDGVWLDAFSIDYSRDDSSSGESLFFRGEDSPHAYSIGLNSSNGLRAYDVTDPDRPLSLGEFVLDSMGKISLGDGLADGHPHYWVTAETGITSPQRVRLVTPMNIAGDFIGADYVILSPGEFFPALSDLVSLRRAQGLAVAMEDIQAIFDLYAGGRPEPDAIRSFLATAYNTWETRPTYVLLVGDGTSDPKRYNASSSATIIPPFLAEVDPWAGETAADNRYVTLDGVDNLPDMLIGRLPVNDLAEAQTVISKIVGYEQSPEPSFWNSNITFVADDPDGGGDFISSSERLLASYIPPTLVPRRLYLNPPDLSAPDLKDILLQDWNAGTGLIMFNGHASIHQWAAEQFIHIDDIPALENGARLPVVLELTCFTGSFQVPAFPTLDEALLRSTEGGAVAVWGPTGLGVATGHEFLAQGFYENIFRDGQSDLGTATLAGKLHLSAQNPGAPDLIDTFTLLGDPASRLNRTNSRLIFLPLVQR